MKMFRSILRHAILLGFLLLSAYPLLWMALASVRTEGDARRYPFSPPREWTAENLRVVAESGSFGQAYVNSVVVCVAGVFGAVALSSCAAFAFARLRFRGQRALFLLFLLGMMVPVHVTLIPLNRLMGTGGLGLKGTLWALIGPYIGFALPLSILILRGAFARIPEELVDAARIDGCSTWGVFTRVALPLVRSAIATVVIFNFLTMWNEFAFALTLLDPARPTLPLAITQFSGEHGIRLTQTCAALTVVVLPLLVVYCLAQKHIIRGLTAGAVKG
ncbi:MAG: carbohydrate ABC transporter permease [Lentisphaeria bacterium]|nr:carbohydrate ABC transporter permease [Lentisphaeria bacterium]